MKRVLVLNGDSYVGRNVVKAFYQSQEYDVAITRTRPTACKAATTRDGAESAGSGYLWSGAAEHDAAHATHSIHKRRYSDELTSLPPSERFQHQQQELQRQQAERASLPADIRPCVTKVVPKHNDDTEGFHASLLACDVVVAVLDDDAYEATCAIRILQSTIYEVEKTFVLVSSAITWSFTLESERERARLTRQRQRAEARNSFLDVLLDEEDEGREDGGGEGAAAAALREVRRAARRQQLEQRLPHSLREPQPGEDEDEIRELVPDRVFTEDAYAKRVPHPRFQHWRALEHLVKRANTQTLHTYVVFAGLPYGAGEGECMLFGLLRSAWYHQPLLQYGPGLNALPMIHVQDLAAILFKLGNAFDTLEERYLFAVDQGKVTQRQLLQAVQARLGGTVQPAKSSRYRPVSIAAAAASVSTAGAAVSYTASSNNAEPSLSTPHILATQTLAAATPNGAVASANLVALDRLELPPANASAQELFHAFGNEPCWGDGSALLSAFVLSDMQAEPAAVLNVHPAEEWVALEGFTASLDLVLAEFREAHGQAFRPVKILITGPPLSGAETLAALMAHHCHAPLLALPTVVSDYTQHVTEVRTALRGLLMRRLQRRRDRQQAKLVRQAVQAKHTRRAERAARRAARAAAQKARRQRQRVRKNGEDDDGAASDGEGTEEADAAAEAADVTSGDSLNSSYSVYVPIAAPTSPSAQLTRDGEDGEDDDEDGRREEDQAAAAADAPRRAALRDVRDVVNEAYIRGDAAAGAGGDGAGDDDGAGEGEGGAADTLDEEEEEAEGRAGGEGGATWLDQLEEQDAERQAEVLESQELLPEDTAEDVTAPLPRFAARRRGRAFARDVDRQELRCITALRREYLLGLKVLALKVSSKDGRLPRPAPPRMSAGGDDEEDSNNENTSNNNAVRGRGGQMAISDDEGGSDGGSEEDHRGEKQRDESSNEDGGEGEEDESATSLSSSHVSIDVAAAMGLTDLAATTPQDYLDVALAFMLRWRLRQADCRCQGYVLGNFPQTLPQAVLCFKANKAELEDGELRRQRALAPLLTRLDDHDNSGDAAGGGGGDDDEGSAPLPPPLDEDFPLPDIASMEESQLRALEAAHWRSRGGRLLRGKSAGGTVQKGEGEREEEGEEWTAGMEAEGVMAAVDEALFVDQVVSLQTNPTLLRATAEALETHLRSTHATPDGTGGGSGSHGGDAIEALRCFLAAAPYTARLADYGRHHAPAAPPTQSLLAWLNAVTTTEARGMRPAPVLVPLGSGAGGDTGGAAAMSFRDGEDGEGESGGAATMEAPPTTRTAEVVVVPAPVLSVPQVVASWVTAYEAQRASAAPPSSRRETARNGGEGMALVESKLPMALLRLAPLFWTGEAVRCATPLPSTAGRQRPSSSTTTAAAAAAATKAVSPPPPAALCDLQRAMCAKLVPQPRLAACAAAPAADEAKGGSRTKMMALSDTAHSQLLRFTGTTAASDDSGTHYDDHRTSVSSISQERQGLSGLERREDHVVNVVNTEGAAQVMKGRTALRTLQLAEESRHAAALLAMPPEVYLMRFVLPSLTPAMTEVVRTRADDPVTALADVLFDYQRRTTIK